MDQVVEAHDLNGTKRSELIPANVDLTNILNLFLLLWLLNDVFNRLVQDVVGVSIQRVALRLHIPCMLFGKVLLDIWVAQIVFQRLLPLLSFVQFEKVSLGLGPRVVHLLLFKYEIIALHDTLVEDVLQLLLLLHRFVLLFLHLHVF